MDDRTIVFVADPTFGNTAEILLFSDYNCSVGLSFGAFCICSGNILNFNVGATVDLDIPRSFWSRLAGQYGNMFYWKEKVKL